MQYELYKALTFNDYDPLLKLMEPMCFKAGWKVFPNNPDDGIQLARIEMLRAIKGFDPSRGRFTTFAMNCMYRRMYQIKNQRAYTEFISLDETIFDDDCYKIKSHDDAIFNMLYNIECKNIRDACIQCVIYSKTPQKMAETYGVQVTKILDVLKYIEEIISTYE